MKITQTIRALASLPMKITQATSPLFNAPPRFYS